MQNSGDNPAPTQEFPQQLEAQTVSTAISTHTKLNKSNWNTKLSLYYAYYVAPYIRMPLLLYLALQILMISGNLTTVRNNSNKLFDMRNIDPARYGDPNGPPEDRVNYVLPDLGFSYYGVTLQNNDLLLYFLDGSPTFGLIVLVGFLIYFRDPFLWAECIWIESFMSLIKAPAQLMTSLPDPYGQQAPCWDPKYGEYGSWIVTRWSATFCGDCIWSYHTWHWIFPMLYIHRFLRQTRFCSEKYLWTFRIIVTLWTIALVTVIIFIQFHYSVDVWIALFLSVFVLTHTPFVHWGANLLYLPPSESLKNEIQALKSQEYESQPYERMESKKQFGDVNLSNPSASPINEQPSNINPQATSPKSPDSHDLSFHTTATNLQKHSLSSSDLQSLSSDLQSLSSPNNQTITIRTQDSRGN